MENVFFAALIDEYMEKNNISDSEPIKEAEEEIKTRLSAIDPKGLGVDSVYDDCIARYYNAVIDQGFMWGFTCAVQMMGGRQ